MLSLLTYPYKELRGYGVRYALRNARASGARALKTRQEAVSKALVAPQTSTGPSIGTGGDNYASGRPRIAR
jgi:hypothetical protein